MTEKITFLNAIFSNQRLEKIKHFLTFVKIKPLKWLLYFLSGLIFFMLMSLYFILSSGVLTEKVVLNARPYLIPFGIELNQLESLKLNAFDSLTLKNISVNWHDDELGQVAVKLKVLDVRYSFANLFDGILLISKFQLEDLSISGAIALKASGVIEKNPSETFQISDIETLISTLPIDVNVENVSMKNINIDLQVKQDDWLVDFDKTLTSLNAKFLVDGSKINGQYELVLADDGGVTAALLMDGVKTNVSFNPILSVGGQLALQRINDVWGLSGTSFYHQATIEDFQLKQSSGPSPEKAVLELKAISLNLKTNIISSEKVDAHNAGLEAIFPLSIKNNLNLDFSRLRVDEFSLSDLTTSGNIGHTLSLTSNFNVNENLSLTEAFGFSLKDALSLRDMSLLLGTDEVSTSQVNVLLSMLVHGVKEKDETNIDFNTKLNVNSEKLTYKGKSEKVISLSLRPKMDVSLKGRTKLIDKLNNKLNNKPEEQIINKMIVNTKLDFSHVIDVGQLLYKENNRTVAAVNKTAFTLQAKQENRDVNIKLNAALDGVNLDMFARKFSFEQALQVKANLNEAINGVSSVDARMSTEFLGKPLLNAQFNIIDKPRQFSVVYDFDFEMLPEMQKTIPDLIDIYTLGRYQFHKQGSVDVKHNALSVVELNFHNEKLLDELTISAKGQMKVTQLEKPNDDLFIFDKPLSIAYVAKNTNNYSINVDVTAPSVLVKPLIKPIPLVISSQNEFNWPLSKVFFSAKIKTDDESILDYKVEVKNKKNRLVTKAQVELNAKPEWNQYIENFNALKPYGVFNLGLTVNSEISHQKNSILNMDFENLNLENINVVADVNTVITQLDMPLKANIEMISPIELNQTINWRQTSASWGMAYHVPNLRLPNIVKLNVAGDIKVSTDHGLTSDAAIIGFNLKQGKVEVPFSGKTDDLLLLDVGPLITPIDLKISATGLSKMQSMEIDGNQKIMLDKLSLTVGKNLFDLSVKGDASLDGRDVELESLLSLRPYKNMLQFFDKKNNVLNNVSSKEKNRKATNYLSGEGELSLPLNISLFHGKQMSLSGAVEFKHFSLESEDFILNDADGVIAFNEEFKIDGDYLHYAYLKQVNPFQRVDFGRIRPFIDSPTVSVKSVGAGGGGLLLENIMANISVEQNLLDLQQFNIRLFDGHVVGKFYLDTTPSEWKVGLLSRMTGIDMRKMFPNNTYVQATKYSPINMRVAFELDVQKKLIEGRIDIAKIKQDQLLQLLEFVDPDHIDPQLSSLRKALGVAHPETVMVEMQQGLMNIEVTLSALPKPFRIIGIPLSALMQQFAENFIEMEAQFPVQ